MSPIAKQPQMPEERRVIYMTRNLDRDVYHDLRLTAVLMGTTMEQVVNQALRIGLDRINEKWEQEQRRLQRKEMVKRDGRKNRRM